MPYPGIPKELTPKMDRCVKKVMKDGKSKSSAIAICRTSIMSQTKEEPEKPRKVVADKPPRYMFFSSSEVKPKTLNAAKEGKLLKNVEVFKAGTYRGIQFKNSGLDKMVAHFHYLKAHGILPFVPIRADHPSMGFFGGGGDIIDKVGGYIADLKRIGRNLVADFRITSDKMWEKISEGTYVNRSAEVGTYDDNDGNIYFPALLGVAWVDIPMVEGLSPTFSYRKGMEVDESAKWDTAFINSLPDAAFAYIESGGNKDEDGKTVPRSKRHFPHHNKSVKNGDDNSTVDLPHLRNALARAPQSPFGDKALPHLKKHAKALKIGDYEYEEIKLISLNDLNNMNPEENKDTFPPEETPAEVPVETPEETPAEIPAEAPVENQEETPVETPAEEEAEVPAETPVETPAETPAETPTEPMQKESFEKMFPNEATELKKLKEKSFKDFFGKLVSEGRIAPVMKDKEMEFARTLSSEQFALYENIKKSSPKIVELDKEQIEGEEPVSPGEGETTEAKMKEADEKADKFIEETN